MLLKRKMQRKGVPMKNPIYSINKIQHSLTIDYSAQIVNAYRPIVTKHAKQLLKKLSKIVIEENLQTGMLHLFFGKATANAYNQGNSQYYESFYAQMPTVLTEWLLLQLLKTDNTLSGELFTAITDASSTVQSMLKGSLH